MEMRTSRETQDGRWWRRSCSVRRVPGGSGIDLGWEQLVQVVEAAELFGAEDA